MYIDACQPRRRTDRTTHSDCGQTSTGDIAEVFGVAMRTLEDDAAFHRAVDALGQDHGEWVRPALIESSNIVRADVIDAVGLPVEQRARLLEGLRTSQPESDAALLTAFLRGTRAARPRRKSLSRAREPATPLPCAQGTTTSTMSEPLPLSKPPAATAIEGVLAMPVAAAASVPHVSASHSIEVASPPHEQQATGNNAGPRAVDEVDRILCPLRDVESRWRRTGFVMEADDLHDAIVRAIAAACDVDDARAESQTA